MPGRFTIRAPQQSERFFLGSIARQLADWAPAGSNNEFRAFDLACRRDILHVQDVAAAYQRLLEDGRPNETYNICSGQALTCREIVSVLAAEFGRQIELAEEPVADNDGHIHALCGDNAKIRQELGWNPTHSVQDALRELRGQLSGGTGAGQPLSATPRSATRAESGASRAGTTRLWLGPGTAWLSFRPRRISIFPLGTP